MNTSKFYPDDDPAARTILIVDDQADMAALIAHHLRTEGFQTQIASSGAQARAWVQASVPNLILLDVLMHDANGFDLCREFKLNKELALIPVVLITSLDSKQDRIRGIQAGCDEFLSKPVNRDELRARVQSLLKLQTARKTLEHERLAYEQDKRAAMRQTFERYVAPNVVEQILNDGGQAFMAHSGERHDAVAMFADMRGFTRMSEALTPLQVVHILNTFFSTLTAVAHRHQGTILSMAGDCLLIGFGVPLALPDIERNALLAAHDIVQETQPLVEAWHAQFGVTVGVGIGLNRGDVIVGNVGSPSYMSYTMIGDTVNVAARLTELARAGEIICAGRMRDGARALPAQLLNERSYDVLLKGKTLPVQAYGYNVP